MSWALCLLLMTSTASAGSTSLTAGDLIEGDLVITEIFQNPKAVNDDKGEGFEILNNTPFSIDLTGLFVEGGSIDFKVTKSVVVAPGDRAVFMINGDSALNGGVPADYDYTNFFFLRNDTDTLCLYTFEGGDLLDCVNWDIAFSFPLQSGASMALTPGQEDVEANDYPESWCLSTTDGGLGDLHTLGYENDQCADWDLDGYIGTSDGGDDCDDTDPLVHPGLVEGPQSSYFEPVDVPVFQQGLTNGGARVDVNRSDPWQCLVYNPVDTDSAFCSLGFGGSVVMAFPVPLIEDPNGMITEDLVVYEKTYAGSAYPSETALVEVWDPVLSLWVSLGSATNGTDTDRSNVYTSFDLGGVTGVVYVRITDTTDPSLHDANADGFDVNAVFAVHANSSTCDGVDNDCDGKTDEGFDTDLDGWAWCLECDDTDPLTYPGATELCDGKDNDCDSQVDEGLDKDGDGYASCVDCDDSDAAIHPGATEVCNGVDDDCDGEIDEGWDWDGDGYASCVDCDDTDATIHPSAEEVCNGLDDDCDNDPAEIAVELDKDGDGYSVCDGDCDDTEGAVYPGATEVCDGLDNDCDGTTTGETDSDGNGFLQCADCNTAADSDIRNCNSDPGKGDKCNPRHNTKGCSAEFFALWCKRRKSPKDYYAYTDYHRAWVQESGHCDGTISWSPSPSWPPNVPRVYCTGSNGVKWYCKTPLVLSFSGQDATFIQASGSFDLGGLAPDEHTDWPRAATPWLARDLNLNGRIDDGAELFGSGTRLPEGGLAQNGTQALAALDHNKDGRISPEDPAWYELLLWSDRNADRVSQPAELQTLSAWGVSSISLKWSIEERCDARGNCNIDRSNFEFTDARGQLQQGVVIDVYLQVHSATPLAWPE